MSSGDESPERIPPVDPSTLRRAPHPLRDAVYRREASNEDRSALAAALDSTAVLPPKTGDPATSGARPDDAAGARRLRSARWRIAGVLVVAVALTGLWGGITQPRHPRPARAVPRSGGVTVPARALAGHGDPEERQRQRHALAHLFDGAGKSSLTKHLIRHYPGLIVDIPARGSRVDRLFTGPHAVDIGHLSDRHATGVLRVLLLCDTRAPFSWTLIAPGPEHDDPTAVTAHGSDCSGQVLASSLRTRQLPTRLEVVVPRGVRVLVTVQIASH